MVLCIEHFGLIYVCYCMGPPTSPSHGKRTPLTLYIAIRIIQRVHGKHILQDLRRCRHSSKTTTQGEGNQNMCAQS
jgi:hypothetical protein